MKNSIIAKLKGEGNLKMYLDFRSGHANDLSKNSNNATLNSTVFFSKNGISFTTAPTVSSSASLTITGNVTLVTGLYVDRKNRGSNPYVLFATGTSYNYALNSNGAGSQTLTYYDGAVSSTASVSETLMTDRYGSCCYAVTATSSSKPYFYANGNYLAQGNNNVTVSGGATTLNVGYTFINGFPIKYSLIISRVLTATEHALLYAELESARWPTKPYANTKKPNDNLLTDGDMEASGTTAWTAVNNATLSKQTTNPYNGKQCLRIAYNGTNYPGADQVILTAGKRYKITGKARGDGVNGVPRIYGVYDTRTIFLGTTSTTWQDIDTEFIATGTNLRFYCFFNGAGYAEFDDMKLVEIPSRTNFQTEFGVPVSVAARGGAIGQYLENTPFQFGDATGRFSVATDTVNGKLTKVITCSTAGKLYIPTQKLNQTTLQAAYGEWGLLLNVAVAGSTTTIMFVASVIGNRDATGQNGYYGRYAGSSGGVSFGYSTAGVANDMFTATSVFTAGTWLKVNLPRTGTGVFTHKINNVVTPATTGTNPVTNNTHTTSSYMVFNMNVGDKIALGSLCNCNGLFKSIL